MGVQEPGKVLSCWMDFRLRLINIINRKGWLICTTGNQDKGKHQASVHEQAHQGEDQQGYSPVIEQSGACGDVFFYSGHRIDDSDIVQVIPLCIC